VTLSSNGSAPLTISSIAASAGFAETDNCPLSPSTLAPGSSCTINVTFTPQAAGAAIGTITVTDDAGNSPQTVALSGTGTAPSVTLSRTSLSFGGQPLTTTSATQSLTLTNSGTANLTISNIAASAGFGQTNNCPLSPNTLAAGASCTINVTFAPTVSGANAGTVTVTDNASGSPQTVALSGTGTDFSISATPSSQTVKAGKSATYTLTLTPISGFAGTVALSCSGVPPAGSCSISANSLTLNGTSATATVTVTTANGKKGTPKGTYTLTLTGTFSALQRRNTVTLTVQ